MFLKERSSTPQDWLGCFTVWNTTGCRDVLWKFLIYPITLNLPWLSTLPLTIYSVVDAGRFLLEQWDFLFAWLKPRAFNVFVFKERIKVPPGPNIQLSRDAAVLRTLWSQNKSMQEYMNTTACDCDSLLQQSILKAQSRICDDFDARWSRTKQNKSGVLECLWILKKSIEEIWRPGVTVDVCGTVQWNVGAESSIFLLKDGGVGGVFP